jgi:hypothetical protein
MRVKTYHVPQTVIDACLTRMRANPFKAAEIAQEAEKAGSPEWADQYPVAKRIADRMIQKHRQSLRMIDRKPTWEFQQPTP